MFDKFFDCFNVSSFNAGMRSRKAFKSPYRSASDFRLKVFSFMFMQLLCSWYLIYLVHTIVTTVAQGRVPPLSWRVEEKCPGKKGVFRWRKEENAAQWWDPSWSGNDRYLRVWFYVGMGTDIRRNMFWGWKCMVLRWYCCWDLLGLHWFITILLHVCCLSPSAFFSGTGAISLHHPRSESIFKWETLPGPFREIFRMPATERESQWKPKLPRLLQEHPGPSSSELFCWPSEG